MMDGIEKRNNYMHGVHTFTSSPAAHGANHVETGLAQTDTCASSPDAVALTDETHMPEQTGDAIADPQMERTCRRLRNLPCDYRRIDLLKLLDDAGLSYNFVYLPID